VTRVAWYPIAVGLIIGAVCALRVFVADLRRRRVALGPLLGFVLCLGAGYVILPYVLPPAPPPPDADGFILHYDIRTRTTWVAPVLLLFGVLLVTAAPAFAAWRSYRERDWFQLVAVGFGFALCPGAAGVAAGMHLHGAWQAVRDAGEGNYDVVEGPVADYELKGGSGRWWESFTVGGVAFRYGDGSLSVGLTRTAPNGGPIAPGVYVRIAHRGNVILRVETRTIP
jgi:hypothetical protein